MKKVFSQIRQWVLKHRRKIIYWTLVFFIGQICFFGLDWLWIENEVYAVDNATQNELFQQKTTEWYEELAFLNKAVYVLIYPLLLLAWKLVDNSFVYWEIFWFDAVLWQLWNILKNLANYTLWFLFVYKIFEFLIKWQKSWDIKKLLISSLIAWVWIQASRFFMASLIDVSTILAYSVWWLPISVLKESDRDVYAYNPYVLKNIVDANAKDIDTVHMYLTNTQTWDKKSGEFYISECETFSYKNGWRSEELILAPKMIYYNYTGNDCKKTADNKCHFYGQVYYFGGLYGKIGDNFKDCSNLENCKNLQVTYEDVLRTAKAEIIAKTSEDVVNYIQNGNILQIWDAHSEGGVLWTLWPVVYNDDQKRWLDLYNKWTWEGWQTSRLENVMDGYSYVGVFTALYSSLLNSWRGIIPEDAWTFAALLRVALSLWHVLAIGIPLIAVALVFIMRIGILWIAVVLSPFIVLLSAFKEIWEKVFKWKFLEYFSLKNLIPIIFSPAIICFAISISTVLVTIISELNFSGITTAKSEILWWLVELDVWGLSIWLWKFIISVLWIAVTWFLVWAAVESSKLWKSGIVQGMKNLATTALWSIPIVPVVWKDENWKLKADFVWTSAAFGDWWIVSAISSDIKNEFSKKDNQVLQDIVDPERVKKRRADAYKTAITSFTPTTTSWTTERINLPSQDGRGYSSSFVDLLDTEKEGIIAAINGIADENKRKEFWRQGEVKFNNWEREVTYVFNTTSNKYELQWGQWS